MTEKKKGGFATMDPELQREISRKGGQAAHQQGTAHKWTTEEAKAAGRKGGAAVHAKRKTAAAIKVAQGAAAMLMPDPPEEHDHDQLTAAGWETPSGTATKHAL